MFLSGGFKMNWQSNLIESLRHKFLFYNPSEHCLEDSAQYTAWDLHYIKKCDIVFAYMEATNPSGYGLMLELGVAYSLGKTSFW